MSGDGRRSDGGNGSGGHKSDADKNDQSRVGSGGEANKHRSSECDGSNKDDSSDEGNNKDGGGKLGRETDKRDDERSKTQAPAAPDAVAEPPPVPQLTEEQLEVIERNRQARCTTRDAHRGHVSFSATENALGAWHLLQVYVLTCLTVATLRWHLGFERAWLPRFCHMPR